MKVLVLEDERPAREQLIAAVEAWDPSVEIVACLDAVAAACRWLASKPVPDLVLADVRLTDGSSIEVFERMRPTCPIIFVTAYDRFTLEALEAGGIDYVLKPIDRRRVAAALDKVVTLRRHFQTTEEPGMQARYRQRLLVRHRGATLPVSLAEVAGFSTEDRLVILTRADGARFVVDRTLADLSRELDPSRFFRVNRSQIVALETVVGFSTAGKGRLRLALGDPVGGEVLVSAEHAEAFRRWLDR